MLYLVIFMDLETKSSGVIRKIFEDDNNQTQVINIPGRDSHVCELSDLFLLLLDVQAAT